ADTWLGGKQRLISPLKDGVLRCTDKRSMNDGVCRSIGENLIFFLIK
ncbi:hypothetical protein HMPREF1604_00043, partial [Escherichia coli 908519]